MRPCGQKLKVGLLLALIAILPTTSHAAKRVTVAQLSQFLTSSQADHKRDAEIVEKISSMVLTERLTEGTLDRVSLPFSGSPVLPALHLLADQSALLPPPLNESPTAAPPDESTRQHILDAGRQYALQTLPHLPDFLATRTTLHYDDSPSPAAQGQWPMRTGLHLVDRSSQEISVRDAHEGQLPTQSSGVWRQATGLVSGGEFGATLGMVLIDTANQSVTWGHWEQNATGLIAVFDFKVPRSASHFEVLSASPQQSANEAFASNRVAGRGVSGIDSRPSSGSPRPTIQRIASGYHGSLWIDPATGTILRITLEAELKRESLNRAAIVVEYGSVEIGSKTFVCPVRSLAFSHAVDNATALQGDAPTEWLNETLFTNYHHFDASVRVLPDTQTPQ